MASFWARYEKAFRKAFNIEKPNKRMTLEDKYALIRMHVIENNGDLKKFFIYTLGWFSASFLAFLNYFCPECSTSGIPISLSLLIVAACFMFSCILGMELNIKHFRKAEEKYKESRRFKETNKRWLKIVEARESHANKKTKKR